MFILRIYIDNTKIYTVKIPRAHGSLNLVHVFNFVVFKEQRLFFPLRLKRKQT